MDPFHNDIKNKKGSVVWGLCMEGLRRGWYFTMIGMKKLQDIFGWAYILSSNGNACFAYL